jgi:lipid-A-disaccharide synthase
MDSKSPNIVIVTGEASGDLYGAHLAAQLTEMCPELQILGVGSSRMRKAGVRLLRDSSSWSAIGIVQALKVVPALEFAFYRLRKYLAASPPDLLVLVDFGAFNVRLAGRVHPLGIKTLYFIPPGSWYRGKTYKSISGNVDRVVTPFPWSHETLQKEGFASDFLGHPLLDIVKPTASREDFFAQFSINPSETLVGLLPGSRGHEVSHVLPAELIAAGMLAEKDPSLTFAIPLASSICAQRVAEELSQIPWIDMQSFCPQARMRSRRRYRIEQITASLVKEEGWVPPKTPVRIKLLPGQAGDILAYSKAAIVTSGTATVEGAILGCPMVIVYRGSRLMQLEYKLLGKGIKYIGMPNIVLDRVVCPELMGDDASPRHIAELVLPLLTDSGERGAALSGLAEVRAYLGEPGAICKTARLILSMIGHIPEEGVV